MFNLFNFSVFLKKHEGITYALVNSENEARQVAQVGGTTMIAAFKPFPNADHVRAYLYADKDKEKEDIKEFLGALQKELDTGVNVKIYQE